MTQLYQEMHSLPSIEPGWEPVESYIEPQLYEISQQMWTQWGGRQTIPQEIYAFMYEQYSRFNITPPDRDMFDYCWSWAFEMIDSYDPYFMFHGYTDVILTENNYFFQFSSTKDDGETWEALRAEECEHYETWDTDKYIDNWNLLMSRPGLKESFDSFHEYLYEHFRHVEHDSHPECYKVEWELMNKYGKQAQDLMHLGIWASLMWLISPTDAAKRWRSDHNPIFETAYKTGSCLLSNWNFYGANDYTMDDHPAETCIQCNERQWCVDLVQVDRRNTVFICESCLSRDVSESRYPEEKKDCGTRICNNTGCPHHPQAGRGVTSLERSTQRYGKLEKTTGGRQVRALPGIVTLNQIALDQAAKSIAMDTGKEFRKMLDYFF